MWKIANIILLNIKRNIGRWEYFKPLIINIGQASEARYCVEATLIFYFITSSYAQPRAVPLPLSDLRTHLRRLYVPSDDRSTAKRFEAFIYVCFTFKEKCFRPENLSLNITSDIFKFLLFIDLKSLYPAIMAIACFVVIVGGEMVGTVGWNTCVFRFDRISSWGPGRGMVTSLSRQVPA